MVMVIFINKAFNVIYFTYILTILGFYFTLLMILENNSRHSIQIIEKLNHSFKINRVENEKS